MLSLLEPFITPSWLEYFMSIPKRRELLPPSIYKLWLWLNTVLSGFAIQ